MSDAKNVSALPGTEEGDGGNYMKVGLHLVKVKEILEGINHKTGNAIIDNNNNLSLRIVFVNKAGEVIDSIYFYSTLPIGDPGRKDDSIRCKSEWRLKELKTVMGLPVTTSVPLEKVKAAKLWIAVRVVESIDGSGEPVLNDKGNPKAYHEIFKIFPYDPESPTKGRPMLKGDPDRDQDNYLVGEFYEKKIMPGITHEKVVISKDEPIDDSEDVAEDTQSDDDF